MRALVFGVRGFLGGVIAESLRPNYEVFGASLDSGGRSNEYTVDLTRKDQTAKIISKLRPEIIINAAGIVQNTEAANLNPVFTQNILEGVIASEYKPSAIVVIGSAGEYGEVLPEQIPVKETVSLRATSLYGRSKIQETTNALALGEQHDLPVVVARIFNPIGVGMPGRLLIPGLIRQMEEIRQGERDTIEVSRLDAERDYIDVHDVARAIHLLVAGQPREKVYNVGSGISTSTRQLIEYVFAHAGLDVVPAVRETSSQPEPLFAKQADTTRMRQEFGWRPNYSIEDTIEEIFSHE